MTLAKVLHDKRLLLGTAPGTVLPSLSLGIPPSSHHCAPPHRHAALRLGR